MAAHRQQEWNQPLYFFLSSIKCWRCSPRFALSSLSLMGLVHMLVNMSSSESADMSPPARKAHTL